MKKRLSNTFIIFLFIIGLTIVLYPFASNWYNRHHQAEIIQNYDNTMDKMKEEELEAERESAHLYNESLLSNIILTDPFDEEALKSTASELSEYEILLNIDDDGIMGYIEIPAIDVQLPIFHGTKPETLEKGVGHLENTSLPVGGSATHVVLSSHTGLPTAKLFTDLIELEKGDLFFFVVLNETLAYEVDQIKVVEPTNTSDLQIDCDKDYVTLVTCTPYGINSHRLLVRGVRTDYVEEIKKEAEQITVQQSNALIIGIIIILGFLILCVVRGSKTKVYRRVDMIAKLVKMLTSIQFFLLISLILICLGLTAGQVSDTGGFIGLTVTFGLMWVLEVIINKMKRRVRNESRDNKDIKNDMTT